MADIAQARWMLLPVVALQLGRHLVDGDAQVFAVLQDQAHRGADRHGESEPQTIS
jgi:hypothetical protein